MVRQFLQGQNFFLQEFGKMCSEVGRELLQQAVGKWGWREARSAVGLGPRGDRWEPWFLYSRTFFPTVLAAGHLRLLSTAPPDYAWLWHQALSHPEIELEFGELLPGEQAGPWGGQGQSGPQSHLAICLSPLFEESQRDHRTLPHRQQVTRQVGAGLSLEVPPLPQP